MAGAQKKVIVRMTGGQVAWGYLPLSGFVASGPPAQVELIEVDAKTKPILLSDIQTIAYVRDLNLDDPLEPERLGRRSFPARPKGEGLWVRVEFHEQPPLEGMLAGNLALLDSLLEDRGLLLTPPDARSNVQRLYVPRSAVRGFEVLGWIASPSRRLAEKSARQAGRLLQAGLFED